jgi:hypothetical protein
LQDVLDVSQAGAQLDVGLLLEQTQDLVALLVVVEVIKLFAAIATIT